MALIVDRLAHQTKILVGKGLERYLAKQYWLGKGPAGRLISVFSDELKQIGVEQTILVDAIPLNKTAPDYFLEGTIESEYRNRFLASESFTEKAGIFSARNVEVSFPTSMHQVGGHILKEVMLGTLSTDQSEVLFRTSVDAFFKETSRGRRHFAFNAFLSQLLSLAD